MRDEASCPPTSPRAARGRFGRCAAGRLRPGLFGLLLDRERRRHGGIPPHGGVAERDPARDALPSQPGAHPARAAPAPAQPAPQPGVGGPLAEHGPQALLRARKLRRPNPQRPLRDSPSGVGAGREHRLGHGHARHPRADVRAWMHSPGHRANILSADSATIGIGIALGAPAVVTPPRRRDLHDGLRRQGLGPPAVRRSSLACRRLMADVQPLRALHYDLERVGALADLVAPPYDVIDAAQRAELAAARPTTSSRSTCPRPTGDPYDAAAALLERLAARGRRRPRRRARAVGARPGVRPARTAATTRRGAGSSAACGSRTTAPGRIRPHERTHPGPEGGPAAPDARDAGEPLPDLLALLRPGRRRVGRARRRSPSGEPWGEVDRRRRHASTASGGSPTPTRSPPSRTRCADAELLIADGHHRYETARVYAEEVGGEGPHRYVLMCLVALEDPGLTVFPTHRLVRGLDAPTQHEALATALARDFDVAEIDARGARARAATGRSRSATSTPTSSGRFMLTLKDQAIADARARRALRALPPPRHRGARGADPQGRAGDDATTTSPTATASATRATPTRRCELVESRRVRRRLLHARHPGRAGPGGRRGGREHAARSPRTSSPSCSPVCSSTAGWTDALRSNHESHRPPPPQRAPSSTTSGCATTTSAPTSRWSPAATTPARARRSCSPPRLASCTADHAGDVRRAQGLGRRPASRSTASTRPAERGCPTRFELVVRLPDGLHRGPGRASHGDRREVPGPPDARRRGHVRRARRARRRPSSPPPPPRRPRAAPRRALAVARLAPRPRGWRGRCTTVGEPAPPRAQRGVLDAVVEREPADVDALDAALAQVVLEVGVLELVEALVDRTPSPRRPRGRCAPGRGSGAARRPGVPWTQWTGHAPPCALEGVVVLAGASRASPRRRRPRRRAGAAARSPRRPGDRQRPAGAEVVLDVDDDQAPRPRLDYRTTVDGLPRDAARASAPRARGGRRSRRARPHRRCRAGPALRRGRGAARGLHPPPRTTCAATPARSRSPAADRTSRRRTCATPRCARPRRRSGCPRTPSRSSARSRPRRPS